MKDQLALLRKCIVNDIRGITNIPYKSNSKVIFLQKYT